jgi:hypothetical protein
MAADMMKKEMEEWMDGAIYQQREENNRAFVSAKYKIDIGGSEQYLDSQRYSFKGKGA